MIAVVQRVRRSAVHTDGEKISEISQGLLTLLGIEQGDQESDLQILISKILELRVFQDEQDKMNLSLKDIGGEHLIVSQFTLVADVRKGRRPSFVQAERPERAEPLYELALRLSSDQGVPTKGGKFGADMRVEIENDGPVTILIQVQKGQFL